jgi:hypothetical protein
VSGMGLCDKAEKRINDPPPAGCSWPAAARSKPAVSLYLRLGTRMGSGHNDLPFASVYAPHYLEQLAA